MVFETENSQRDGIIELGANVRNGFLRKRKLMKKTHFSGFVLFIFLLFTLLINESKGNTEKKAEPKTLIRTWRKDTFFADILAKQKIIISNTKTFPAIKKGFIVVDGQYIDAPYYFEVKQIEAPEVGKYQGIFIFLNGKILYPFNYRKKTIPLTGDIDPPMPESCKKDTSYYDKKFQDYLCKKLAYLKKHYKKEKLKEMLEEAFIALPMVEEVEVSLKKNSINLRYFNGKEYMLPIFFIGRRPAPLEKNFKSAVWALKIIINVKLLKNNGCIIVDLEKLNISETKAVTLLKTLNANNSEEKRIKALQEIKKYPNLKDWHIIKDFVGSKQLNERLEMSEK